MLEANECGSRRTVQRRGLVDGYQLPGWEYEDNCMRRWADGFRELKRLGYVTAPIVRANVTDEGREAAKNG